MSERLNDMLDRYGEVCQQKQAAQILSVTPRTIARIHTKRQVATIRPGEFYAASRAVKSRKGA